MKKADIQQLPIARFDYLLPDEKIAKYPLRDRDESKLLLYQGDRISVDRFAGLGDHLPPDSLLVFNNTKVIHARLIFQKATGARIEVFCLSPREPGDYVRNFQQRQRCTWNCLIGNARRWKQETLEMEIPLERGMVTLRADKVGTTGGEEVVAFSWNNERVTFSELLDAAGKLPIPPYLNRPAEASDDETYQTVYSRVEGSVAAPTAGLHFTPGLMDRLRHKGIKTAEVTLHVGAGTFKPVKAPTMEAHEMHTEFISIPLTTIQTLYDHPGKVVAVGTTSARTIESLYYIGKKLNEQPDFSPSLFNVEQWEPYDESSPIAPKQALEAILRYLDRTGEQRLTAATRLMIAPGYRFHFPDALITNFHQPQSTLLLLVSAFVGDEWRTIYRFALENDFRFLSYGDGSLLWKNHK